MTVLMVCVACISTAPPGTSDEHISIVQYLKESTIDGAVVITTPQVGSPSTSEALSGCLR